MQSSHPAEAGAAPGLTSDPARGIASRRAARLASLAAAFCLFAASAAAQTIEPPPAPRQKGERPRIALVLGGGGAKGAAHIGVIKVLEEMRIPVDCIAGTSMGSIVGAAYATGMSAKELEQVITAVNWKEILASAPREDYPFHRKQLDFAFTLGLELGWTKDGIIPPTGLVPTHQIEALFRRIVAGAGRVPSFDRLPIPFRAVSTDLESGGMVVFDRGDLATAMRASMAVPGAFAPVEDKGRLLVDGMLVRNLPVDVGRQLCGDVVIAVPVGNPAVTREKLNNLGAIAGQAMNIAIESNEKAQLATLRDADVAIPVILQNVGSADFALVPEAIPVGEAAARKMVEALSRYSLPPQEYAEWRAGLGRLYAEDKGGRIDELRMRGFATTNPEVIRSQVESQPGTDFDPAKADRDATRIVARGDYTAVSYELTAEDGGRNVLAYNAVEKPWGPDYLLFDINLGTNGKGDTVWGLRADLEKRWLNALGAELRTSVQLGRPNLVSVEYYQPLDLRQRFFFAPSVFGTQTLYYLYSGDTRLGQVDARRFALRLEGGAALDTWGELRVGLLRGGVVMNSYSGRPEDVPDLGHNSLGAATLRFGYDTFDKRIYATSGTLANVNANFSNTGLGADATYRTASFTLQHVLTTHRNVMTFTLKGGSDFDTGAPFYDQFRLGGMFNLSGLRMNQLVGREFAFGSLQVRRPFAMLNRTLGTAAYAGATLELGNVYRRYDGTPASGAIAAGSLFVGIDSKIGPLWLTYGVAEGGSSALYLYIGSPLDAY